MTLELLPFQKEGVEFLSRHHYAILADPMGKGKSAQALQTAIETDNLDILIICPTYLKVNWEMEIKKHFQFAFNSIKIVPYSQLKTRGKDLRGAKFVICDESHYLKTPSSQRTLYFYNFLKAVGPERVLFLTGTPIKNRVIEFYMLLYFCGLNPQNTSGLKIQNYFKSYEEFGSYFSWEIHNEFNGIPVTTYRGLKNADKLKMFLEMKYLRRDGPIEGLPELRRIFKYSDNPKNSKALMEAFLEYQNNKPDLDGHIMRAKATNAYCNVKFTLNLADEIIEESGGQVIIFTDHVASSIDLQQRLSTRGLKNRIINGQTPMNDRAGIIKDFEDKKFSVLVMTIGTGSLGLNLQFCNTIIFSDFPWVPGDLAQAEKRIHRIGQTKECTVYYVFNSEMDAMIYQQITDKNKVINAAI